MGSSGGTRSGRDVRGAWRRSRPASRVSQSKILGKGGVGNDVNSAAWDEALEDVCKCDWDLGKLGVVHFWRGVQRNIMKFGPERGKS